MENQELKINLKTVWLLAVGNILLTIVIAIAFIQNWEFLEVFLTLGLMLLFATWVIILSDMAKNNIYNKEFWISTMIILPTITQIFYLLQRNKLIRLGNRLDRKAG
ncbi:MAG TPA: hypothetical protein VLH61_09495 [Bacteroidales bacterium]|nr:hypothetical protein [Bacteroidales bacterium]